MQGKDDAHKYDDIIDLPHHISPTRPRMSVRDRAAQFAPFAALTGHDAVIAETARLTDACTELDESEKSILNEKLQMILEHIDDAPEVTITYFVPDARKSGGAYVSLTGQVKKIDEYEHQVIMTDGAAIAIDSIYAIESRLFNIGIY